MSDDRLSSGQAGALLTSVFVVAICGLSYELMMGAVATSLLGASILYFSLTIGVFLSSMGIGSWGSRFVDGNLLLAFVVVEILIGWIGGLAGIAVFAAYAITPWFQFTLFGILSIIGILVGLELPLLTRFMEPVGGLRTAISNVMALDYLGSLAASLAFPFIMLPWLGLLSSFFAVGLLNLLAAALTVFAFRDRLPARRLWAVTALGAFILLAGLLRAEQTMSTFERQLYDDPIVHVEQSIYQRLVLTKRGADVRLYIDGHLQLSGVDEFRYHESLVHPAMQMAVDPKRVLLLGAGDGLAAREVLSFETVEHVTLVDLDPAITTLARTQVDLVALNQGAIDDPRLTLVHGDAFRWLMETNETFDVIVLDFPDPHDDGLAKLYSTTMYGLVAKHLTSKGVAVTQASSPYFARKAFWTVEATAASVGLHTLPYHAYVPAFGEWGFVAMGHQELHWDHVLPRTNAKFLNASILATLPAFPPDMDRVPTLPSTLDHPRIAEDYRNGWAEFF